jgi:hypothetical protein
MTEHARQFWKIASISFVLLSLVYVYVPLLRKPLTNEDNLLEMATALMYLAVSVLAVKFLIKRAPSSGNRIDWLVPLLPIIGFAEEVSLGRLFFSETPLVEGVKIDAAHDFLRVFLTMIRSGDHRELLLSLSALAAISAIFTVIIFREQIANLLKYEPFRFCVVWVVLIGFASVVDLDLISHYYLTFLEEYLETLAALSSVFAYQSLKACSNR